LNVDDHCARLSAIDPQSRLFADTRAGDGGFQSAVAKHRSHSCLATSGDTESKIKASKKVAFRASKELKDAI
jgi:hypothetical protein